MLDILCLLDIPLGEGRVVGESVGVALVLTQRHGASEVSSSCSSSQRFFVHGRAMAFARPHGADVFLAVEL